MCPNLCARFGLCFFSDCGVEWWEKLANLFSKVDPLLVRGGTPDETENSLKRTINFPVADKKNPFRSTLRKKIDVVVKPRPRY